MYGEVTSAKSMHRFVYLVLDDAGRLRVEQFSSKDNSCVFLKKSQLLGFTVQGCGFIQADVLLQKKLIYKNFRLV